MAKFGSSSTARFWKGTASMISFVLLVLTPMLYAFSASSDGVVASSTGVAYFCTELSDSPNLLRNSDPAFPRASEHMALVARLSFLYW